MKILAEEDVLLLKTLAGSEAENINMAFNLSDTTGLVFLSNSITSFQDIYLKKIYGVIVFSMCSEYRTFIIELLKNIKSDYQHTALSELLVPQIKKINDEELILILQDSIKGKDR